MIFVLVGFLSGIFAAKIFPDSFIKAIVLMFVMSMVTTAVLKSLGF